MASAVDFWACSCLTKSSFCFGHKKLMRVRSSNALTSSIVGGRNCDKTGTQEGVSVNQWRRESDACGHVPNCPITVP